MRRKLFLTLPIVDFVEATELKEAEVMEVAASEGVFLCLCRSMELSEVVCIDCEALGGSGTTASSDAWLMMPKPEKPFVIKLIGVVESSGRLIPNRSAVSSSSRSRSSSLCSILKTTFR